MFSLQEIEGKMRDWPAGTSLVLECSSGGRHDAPLLAEGSNYNTKKVEVFICTKNAGRTINGDPYEAKYQDTFGNQAIRYVTWPKVVSVYYSGAGAIDDLNAARQHELRLEKHWITHDGFFRIATTIIGITITDAWLAVRNGIEGSSPYKKIGICKFAIGLPMNWQIGNGSKAPVTA
jgi:hypothetical protein